MSINFWRLPKFKGGLYIGNINENFGSSCVTYVFGICSFHEVSHESTRIQGIHGKGEASE